MDMHGNNVSKLESEAATGGKIKKKNYSQQQSCHIISG